MNMGCMGHCVALQDICEHIRTYTHSHTMHVDMIFRRYSIPDEAATLALESDSNLSLMATTCAIVRAVHFSALR